MFASSDIGFLLLLASFVLAFFIFGRVWSIAGILVGYVLEVVAPVIPTLTEQSPRSAGIYILCVAIVTIALRTRIFRLLKSSTMGPWVTGIPLALLAGGFIFSRMLLFLPLSTLEHLSVGARSLFLLPVAQIAWTILPLASLLLVRSRQHTPTT